MFVHANAERRQRSPFTPAHTGGNRNGSSESWFAGNYSGATDAGPESNTESDSESNADAEPES